MIGAVFWAWQHACAALGGHQHELQWRRVPRDGGGVELVEVDACRSCPQASRSDGGDIQGW